VGDSYKGVSEQWERALRADAYAHSETDITFDKVMATPRVWRRIFAIIRLRYRRRQGRSALEVGVGGGKHLVMLAAQGWRGLGIDVSVSVLARAREFAAAAARCVGRPLDIRLVHADLFEYKIDERFDMVYHVGVIEHFLEAATRLAFLRKMFELAKPGGYVVSVVPSGMHPRREWLRREKVSGYDIPEVDYSPDLMRMEFTACGAEDIRIIPHNLFGYLLTDHDRSGKRLAKKVFFYGIQLIPVFCFSRCFSFRHSYSIVGAGRKAL
jgi:SAM-dependent methyltransferase